MGSETWIHVIDDDDAVRESLAFLLEIENLPTRVYDSAITFLDVIDRPSGGCIVTDVRMPEMSGIDLLREMKSRGLAMPVIVITGHGDVPLALEAMRAGAFDLLEKPFADERLLDSVRRALLQPDGVDGDELALVRARLARLSERELQVLKGLVVGALHQTIAEEAGMSARTVEIYRASLMTKMEARDFADLVRMTLLAGEIDPKPD